MKKIFTYGLLLCIIAACNKDKFTTVPQAEIKSFGPSEVTKGDFISFTSVIRDKEGDIDSVILVSKLFNGNNLLRVDSGSAFRYPISIFNIPPRDEFDLSLVISYGEQKQDITLFYVPLVTVDNRYKSIGIVVKDKAGNRSDYVESDKILLKKL